MITAGVTKITLPHSYQGSRHLHVQENCTCIY